MFFFRDQEYVEPDVEEMRGQLQAVKIEGNFVFDKVRWGMKKTAYPSSVPIDMASRPVL